MKNAYVVDVNSVIPFSLGVQGGREGRFGERQGALNRDGLLAGTEVFIYLNNSTAVLVPPADGVSLMIKATRHRGAERSQICPAPPSRNIICSFPLPGKCNHCENVKHSKLGRWVLQDSVKKYL